MKVQTVGNLHILENPDGVVIGDAHADVPITTPEEAIVVLRAINGFVKKYRRRCSKCKVNFYRSKEFFYQRKDGSFLSVCKKCNYSYYGKNLRSNKTFSSYRGAKDRCINPTNSSYKNYGARGIKFLIPSWQELEKAIGPRTKGLTLDRIDVEGHYEIGNVRWATPAEQCKNKRVHVRRQPELLAA